MRRPQNFAKSSPYFWLYVHTAVKSKVKISKSFVAFSEYMNFEKGYIFYEGYFVTKIVLTHCELLRKTFEILGWRLRICKTLFACLNYYQCNIDKNFSSDLMKATNFEKKIPYFKNYDPNSNFPPKLKWSFQFLTIRSWPNELAIVSR